jgi:acyl-CoA hydrolase
MTAYHQQSEQAAKSIIAAVGKNIVIGLPLGLGKPVKLTNALYQMAVSDPSIQLTIITALTLARPPLHNELEKRFAGPFLDRLLGDYEELLYEDARVKQQLPANIRVIEFFLSTAKFLHNAYVQQNYISSSYTDVSRDVFHYGINVIGQLVSNTGARKDEYSLSCNSDLFHAVVEGMQAQGKNFAVIAEVNNNLPFMLGDAVIQAQTFTDIIDTGHYPTLFSVPHDELSIKDQLIGLYTSTLIKDDSCLQIGIGKLSNALTSSLLMRQKNNADYQAVLKRLQVAKKFGDTITALGDTAPFERGLYASTEMLCDGYLQLYKEDILKKNVYDDVGLQKLLNTGKIQSEVTPEMFQLLLSENSIHAPLTAEDVEFLVKYGIFKAGIQFSDEQLILADGKKISASASQNEILAACLGTKLENGIIIHAGFFLGTQDMYEELRNLTPAQLKKINMTAVARTNSMLWRPELLQLQRQQTRFVNSAMMVTLGAVIVSDGLENLQEVSGVGGQFDFVLMATDLPGSRSIINCHSTRKAQGKISSNIVWEYSNVTVPRYLRDIIITEYGIADCRSKTDCEIIKAMLNVTDSRFQPALLATAKKYQKIPADYTIPVIFQNNFPAAAGAVIKEFQGKGYFSAYPFGTEMTPVEVILKNILLSLAALPKWKILMTAAAAWFYAANDKRFLPYLMRMQLAQPKNFTELFYKKLLRFALRKVV